MVKKPKETPRPYHKDWEKEDQFRGWLTRAPESVFIKNKREAYCRWCSRGLRAHKSDLEGHSETNSHKQRAQEILSAGQKRLEQCGVVKETDASKKLDIALVMYVACHGSVRTIDHLTELLKSFELSSEFKKLQLHRTKASMLILNVIAPGLLKELIDDIGEEYYSIIVDESTDVSSTKFMSYAIRYYSRSANKILTNFLGFTRVYEATAEQLHLSFTKFLEENGLDLMKMIGIGTDGASNMCGKNNSLFTRLLEDNPNLQLMQCLCHSLSLSASKAADELPSAVENLIKQSKNYFSHSSLRLEKWETLFATMNDGKMPLRLVALSTTRWLAFSNAVSVILKQWAELKEFFNTAATTFDCKNTEVRVLAEAYKKDDILLYLIFVDPILKEVMSVNVAFQKASADVAALYDDLRLLVISLARRIFKPAFLKPIISDSDKSNLRILHQADVAAVKRAITQNGNTIGDSLLPIDAVDYGQKFMDYSKKTTLRNNDLITIKLRARAYILELVKQLVKRLPRNLDVIERMRCLSPQLCLTSSTPFSVNDLPWDLADQSIDRSKVDSQWRRLQGMRLDDLSPDLTENVTTEEFWIVVRGLKNKAGELAFADLGNLALRALSLPISNAEIERMFSVMTIVKNKLRNRMLMPMLVAIMRIRIHLRVYGYCCRDYIPPKHMLEKFNSTMYGNKKTNTGDDTSNDDNMLVLETLELDGAPEMYNLLAKYEEACLLSSS